MHSSAVIYVNLTILAFFSNNVLDNCPSENPKSGKDAPQWNLNFSGPKFSSKMNTLFFYKNVEDRFGQKIKNFCKITFSPKVLKWQKYDIRTSYVALEKLRTFPQKIHKFSNVIPKFLL